MYIVWDSLTETLIGPFNAYEDAQMFVLHASDILSETSASELTIEPVSEPQDWALDNALDGSLFSTQEAN